MKAEQKTVDTVKNVLIIGNDSALAKAYIDRLQNVRCFTTSRKGHGDFYLDLSTPDAVTSELLTRPFDVAIVFASMSKIDTCDQAPELAKQVNCDALIQLHKKLHVKHWILLSSNVVFSGQKEKVSKHQAHQPCNQYGLSKSLMEAYFHDFLASSSIVRMTKVLTSNFSIVDDFVKQVRSGKAVEVFDDMVMSPITEEQVVSFLCHLTHRLQGGVFQLSGETDVSYFKLVQYVVEKAGLNPNLVKPVKSSLQGPKHSCLAVGAVERSYGFTPLHYTEIF
jgi:dTDP-4-dehydrorhamnose reductase